MIVCHRLCGQLWCTAAQSVGRKLKAFVPLWKKKTSVLIQKHQFTWGETAPANLFFFFCWSHCRQVLFHFSTLEISFLKVLPQFSIFNLLSAVSCSVDPFQSSFRSPDWFLPQISWNLCSNRCGLGISRLISDLLISRCKSLYPLMVLSNSFVATLCFKMIS